MNFHKAFDLPAAEEVNIYAEGEYNVKLDGKMLPGRPAKLNIPAGKHRLDIKVYSPDKVPAVYVQGRTVVSDSSWKVTYEDKEWIDETGNVAAQTGTPFLFASAPGISMILKRRRLPLNWQQNRTDQLRSPAVPEH